MNRYEFLCVCGMVLTCCIIIGLKSPIDVHIVESPAPIDEPMPSKSEAFNQTPPNLTEDVVWQSPSIYCKGLGECKIEVVQSCEDDGQVITSVSVLNPEGSIIQWFEREDVTDVQYDRFPCLEDLNQDGYIDIALPIYGTLNQPSVLYVWTPDIFQFEEVEIQSKSKENNYLNYYEVKDNCIATWTKHGTTEMLYQEYQWSDMKTLLQVYEEVIILE